MSPRNEEQNAAIKDERRDQILSAALRVFAKRGFAATKISDIVAKAGMSHGLVYHYFKSKEEIFLELLKMAMEASSQSLLMMERMPISPIEKVRQTANYILGGIENFEESAYYFLIVTHASVMEGAGEESEELLKVSNVPLESLSRILKAGQEAGEVRKGDPLSMAMVFFAAIQGLAIYKLAMEDFHMPDPEILVGMIIKK
jgi:AcrR family transcriptional regulator